MRVVRPKDAIWEHFGEPYVLPAPLDDVGPLPRSKYSKCLSCDEPIIAATARMRDHWARCKKRPQSIGQLDSGFQPESRRRQRLAHSSSSTSQSQNSMSQLGAASASQMGLGAFSPSGDTVNSTANLGVSFFSRGREHFD
jgi:hypothetical protein